MGRAPVDAQQIENNNHLLHTLTQTPRSQRYPFFYHFLYKPHTVLTVLCETAENDDHTYKYVPRVERLHKSSLEYSMSELE